MVSIIKDNISTNVDRTHDEVESGNSELVKAGRYAVSAFFYRPGKLIIHVSLILNTVYDSMIHVNGFRLIS